MGVIDFASAAEALLTPGSYIDGTAVKLFADNGAEIGDVVFKTIQGGNGVASEIGVGTQAATGGGNVVTGLAYLSLDLGVVGAAIAPALGVLAGVGLYNVAPSFWDNVSEKLVNAGCTIGGKVLAYWNGHNVFLSKSTIEIIKDELVNAGYFYSSSEPAELPDGDEYANPDIEGFSFGNFSMLQMTQDYSPDNLYQWEGNGSKVSLFKRNNSILGIVASLTAFTISQYRINSQGKTLIKTEAALERTYKGVDFYLWTLNVSGMGGEEFYGAPINTIIDLPANIDINRICYAMLYGSIVENPDLQPGAGYPDEEEFPLTYPTWYPWEYPIELPHPEVLPDVYPIKYPGTEPDPYPEQQPAQNPGVEPAPDIYPEILPSFPLPDPTVEPEPSPDVDPDPQPTPDPIPGNPDPDVPSDPVNPNPNPDPSAPIVVPGLPATVDSNKLFTVYNPTPSQLDGLGGYLWDSSIMAAIRDIWQDPMDGIISLQQTFVTPQTGGNHNIILGFLDTHVSSAVVSDQFVTLNCGMVSVPENKQNATDYAPYTSLHLFLPFIGIVELDTAECMNANISIEYKIDVYTGTCLAQVCVTRSLDMPNSPILYTFSGNCSQQIPLTSGNATGLLTALVGACAVGLSVASGGSLSTLAGAQMVGNSLTHEMAHVSHSGNISANAGILGQKKPYLIIGRRHCYDANNYNSFYGFPANKTINIGNHKGFLRVKVCWLKTSALQEEYEEIMRLLEEGVFV